MKVVIPALMLGFLPLVGDVAAPVQHTATISMQRIASESTEGKAATQKLETLRQQRAGEVASKQKELQQSTVRAEAEQRQAELQKLLQQAQVEYVNLQRQLQTEVRSKVDPIVAEIAQQQGIDLVLNTDTAVVWSARRLDITNDVLKKLNATPAPPK